MKKYIGTKEVKARPMTATEAVGKGYKVGNNIGDGYEVEYKDGYKSWSPKEVFNDAYRPVETVSERLWLEQMELGRKIMALGNFIKSERFGEMDTFTQAMLKVQYRIMDSYDSIVRLRAVKMEGCHTNDRFTFGVAIEHLRNGYMVKRHYWQDMCIIKQVPAHMTGDIIPKMQSLPEPAKEFILKERGEISYTSQCLMYDTRTGIAYSWSPSIDDVFAEDWEIVL